MLESAKQVAELGPDMVKLHLLHVIYGTPLAKLYEAGDYVPMERDAYIKCVCDQIEVFPPETVIARLTGDAPADLLLAPEWCRKKTAITNDIDKELFSRNSYQGVYFLPI